MHVVPLRLVLALAVEHLDAVVLAVGHVHPAVGVAADVVGNVELAGVGAGLTPREDRRPVRRELVHPRVAVAVGHVEIALRRQGGVCAAIERLAAHVGPGGPGNSYREQHLALEGAMPDGVIAVVGQPERVVRRHVETVGPTEHAFTPGAQEVAVPVEHDHGMLAPVECVHPVLLVDAHRGDVGVELAPRRQLRPLVDDLVAIRARAQDDRHDAPPRG